MLTGNKNFGPATFFANDSNYKTATSTTGASKKALKWREIEFVSAVSASEALRHRQPSGRFQLFLPFSKSPRARMHCRAPDIFPDFRGAVEAREKKSRRRLSSSSLTSSSQRRFTAPSSVRKLLVDADKVRVGNILFVEKNVVFGKGLLFGFEFALFRRNVFGEKKVGFIFRIAT